MLSGRWWPRRTWSVGTGCRAAATGLPAGGLRASYDQPLELRGGQLHDEASGVATDPGVLERAVRLFEFLARVQQLKNRSPKSVDSYDRVLWFHRLPDHEALTSAHRGGDPEADDPILVVDRLPRLAPPEPSEQIRRWVMLPIDDPDLEPALREELVQPVDRTALGSDDEPESQLELLVDHPEVRSNYEAWLGIWRVWALQDREDQQARDCYGELFSLYVASTNNPEEFELVLASGCLTWTPATGPPIHRHLVTLPVVVDFDDDTGSLTVRPAESGLVAVETDMVEPDAIQDPRRIHDIQVDAQESDLHPLHRDFVDTISRRLVHCLDANGHYESADEPSTPSSTATVHYAPALILRKRSAQGLIRVLKEISDQLVQRQAIPQGLVPLVDPNHTPDPGLSWDGDEGAGVTVDDELFLPLPVNERQLQILRRVDSSAQILVQGPPGTGKTHTAAALISHLLAQGRRVLITAQTDRALKEVRAKLPNAIKPLAVAVVGSAREDMSDLKVAVERIAQAAVDHDPAGAAATVTNSLSRIDAQRQRRAGLTRALVEARESDVRTHSQFGYEGTLAVIAQRLDREQADFSWLSAYVEVDSTSPAPLTSTELRELRAVLTDPWLQGLEPESSRDLVDPATLPGADDFSILVALEAQASAATARYSAHTAHETFAPVARLTRDDRSVLQRRLQELAEEADLLQARPEAWLGSALADVRSRRASIWKARFDQVADLANRAKPLIDALGPIEDVQAPGDLGVLTSLGEAVAAYLAGGGKLKTDAAGRPRIGALAKPVLKQSGTFFDQVRVGGKPPTTRDHVAQFLSWSEATRCLDALDRAWPAEISIPDEDTLRERLQWHVAELEILGRVLRFADWLDQERQLLGRSGLNPPEWREFADVRSYASMFDAANAVQDLDEATAPLSAIERSLGAVAQWEQAAQCVKDLHRAVGDRDTQAYRVSQDRLAEVTRARDMVVRREELVARLRRDAPGLLAAILAEPSNPHWAGWIPRFEDAWAWARARAWVAGLDGVDVNALQAQVNDLETAIRSEVELIAATRAWSHAVSAERITGEARANLEHYAYLVRRLGKGTGKYAAQRRGEVRDAMDHCRPSVPVWIMPIYRIAEQMRIEPDMFDVVIVDEASQAGLEATFLQYLAKKIVVIGDDKQVSPSAVGVDQQQLRDLAGQFLFDDRYRAAWQDPKRSLFDEAKMRYGGLITLTEHRRCVPEIIGFSNRIAYEPDGIRLVPVRQYGADRLDPIKMVYLSDGYTRGQTSKVNPVEVDAVVDQIEKCIADPAYDGMTFGVISLLGPAQAKTIERALLERVSPEEWAARDLRCGDSADFQGSERNVMFLSMVAAPEPGKRLGALTQEMYVQRYNVAVSRAKDQLWLFHSIDLNDVSNADDMRFALLDYCTGVVNRSATAAVGGFSAPVPEDVRVAPFDSLFEQRVFNRLIDRGYTVVPQFPVQGYSIDLVVVGARSRLAIECDGDTWHGPDAYVADLTRQRDIERCDWRFFRVRESAFYVDPAAALAPLWELLDELEIHPSGWTPPAEPTRSHGDDEPSPGMQRPLEPEPAVAPPPLDEHSDSPEHMDQVLDRDSAAPEPEEEDTSLDEVPSDAGDWEKPDAFATDTADGQPEPDGFTESSARPPGVAVESTGEAPAASGSSSLDEYVAFDEPLAAPLAATREQLIDGLVRIVAVEGPVVGDRLQQAYVRAGGQQRVGKQIASALNSAISAAVRKGLIVAESPLNEQGNKPKTFREPSQPSVRVRSLGPRTLDQVPPLEMATLLEWSAADVGWDDEEALFRAALALLGLKRLTPNVVAVLRRLRPLAQGS